jgi:group I intron endonuclease
MSNTYGYIYITTNKTNGKRYIGQHKSKDWDPKYFGSGLYLKQAIKKYGIENFTCFPLAWAWNKKELNQLEIDYIAHYKPEYNIAVGGQGGFFPKTEEHKRKIGEANKISLKGRRLSKETCKKMSEARMGRIVSEETRIKLSKQKGWKHTEESRNKMSEAKKLYYQSKKQAS